MRTRAAAGPPQPAEETQLSEFGNSSFGGYDWLFDLTAAIAHLTVSTYEILSADGAATRCAPSRPPLAGGVGIEHALEHSLVGQLLGQDRAEVPGAGAVEPTSPDAGSAASGVGAP